MLGWLVLVLGRGWLAVVGVVPLAVGIATGRMLAARWSAERRPTSPPRLVTTSIAAIAVVVLVLGLLRPASTPSIEDGNGDPVVGSVTELTPVEIGGHTQWLQVRGVDRANPVLLYLAGGPGGSDMGALPERP